MTEQKMYEEVETMDNKEKAIFRVLNNLPRSAILTNEWLVRAACAIESALEIINVS